MTSRDSHPALTRLLGLVSISALALLALAGCQHPAKSQSKPTETTSQAPVLASAPSDKKPARAARRFTYTPRPYPVDERGFSPVDKALAKAFGREEMVTDDAEEI